LLRELHAHVREAALQAWFALPVGPRCFSSERGAAGWVLPAS